VRFRPTLTPDKLRSRYTHEVTRGYQASHVTIWNRVAIFPFSLNWRSWASKLGFRFLKRERRYQSLPFFRLLRPCPILLKLMTIINPCEIALAKLGEKTSGSLGFLSDIPASTRQLAFRKGYG
jgi:hypothetical protein